MNKENSIVTNKIHFHDLYFGIFRNMIWWNPREEISQQTKAIGLKKQKFMRPTLIHILARGSVRSDTRLFHGMRIPGVGCCTKEEDNTVTLFHSY